MMDLDLQIFTHEEFRAVRTLTENDAVMFCGSDVAKVLGYSNSPTRWRGTARAS